MQEFLQRYKLRPQEENKFGVFSSNESGDDPPPP